MEKDFVSSLLQSTVQTPDFKSSAQPFDPGLQGSSGLNATPAVNNSAPLPLNTKELHGCFYCLPWFRQNFITGANMVSEKKALLNEIPSGCSQKQFLVFDQSGDKTTLVCLKSWNSNSMSSYSKFEIWSGKRNLSADLTDELNANDSEAEDSEEINALLYSDGESDDPDEDDFDEETTSTGHSPSVMTAYDDDKRVCCDEEYGEEVASSGGAVKRRRISIDGYDGSLMDTASSAGADDHGNFVSYNNGESVCGMKRLRKENIREAVEILRSMIPDGKGKDSAMVLDESIRYLRLLKLKAEALGLSSL